MDVKILIVRYLKFVFGKSLMFSKNILIVINMQKLRRKCHLTRDPHMVISPLWEVTQSLEGVRSRR